MQEQYVFECYTAHFGSSEHLIYPDIAKVKTDLSVHNSPE